MVDRNKPISGKLTMDGKLVARSDAYEIKSSQVKERPPAPAPIKAQTPITPASTTPPKPSK
jgi:hypothetical protein